MDTNEADQVIKRTVEVHIKNHIDPYPITLELAATALKAHQEADNRGGSEPEIVQAILHHIKTLLLHRDQASASIFETKE